MEVERAAQLCLSYAGPNRVRFQGSDLRPKWPPLGSNYERDSGLVASASQGMRNAERRMQNVERRKLSFLNS